VYSLSSIWHNRKTAFKCVNRFLEYGEDGLKDFSKASHSPHQVYTNSQIERVIELKLKKRRYGPKKILIKIKE
jgi:hypothetical protein